MATHPTLAVSASMLGLALAMLAGCASVPSQQATPTAAHTTGLQPRTHAWKANIPAHAAVAVNQPSDIAGFEFEMLDPNPDPEVGTMLRYRSATDPGFAIDAFVYIVGFTDEPGLVLADFEQGFGAYMQGAIDAGSYTEYHHRASGRLSIDYPFGSRDGSWQAFHIGIPGLQTALTSITHMHYRAPFAIKLRASQPRMTSDHALREAVAGFAVQLLPRLEMRRNQGCPEDTRIHVNPASGSVGLLDSMSATLLESGMRGCSDYDQVKHLLDRARRELEELEASK
jgi:hypothetical protein